PAVRARRVAAAAAIVVVAAMIAVLLLRPRGEDAPASHLVVALEPGSRAVTANDHTVLDHGGISVTNPGDAPRTVAPPVGPVTLAPGTQATLRASGAPAALYVDVSAGQVRVAGEALPAGQRAVFGDRVAARRLGPRVVVTIVRIDGNQIE